VRFWLVALGGLMIWAVHFLGLYLLASFADVAWRDAAGGKVIGLVFSLACLAAIAAVAWRAASQLRQDEPEDTRAFGLHMAVAGGVIAGVGVVFQTAPLMLA